MEPRPRALAATAIAVAGWALAVVSTGLLVLARPPVSAELWFFVVDVTVAGIYGTVASVTLRRRRHPVTVILAVAAVGGGLAAFGFAYTAYAVARRMTPLEPLVMLQSTAWVPGTLALFLVVPWLVRDHPLGPARLGLAAGAAVTLAFTGVRVLRPAWEGDGLIWAAVAVGLLAAAEAEWRRRRGPVDERNGLGWLALGTATLAVSFVPLVVGLPVPYWTTPVLHLLSQAVFPAAVLVVVLRNRMWGLNLAVSRAVLAGVMTTGLLAVYLAVFWLVRLTLPDEGVAQVAAAAAVAVAVQPLRLDLTRRVHRLVYGTAADPGVVVQRLGSHLGEAGSVDDLLAGLAEDIGRSMRLESVRIETAGSGPTTWGRPTTAAEVVALVHRGELVGRLEVTAPPGEALDARAHQALRDLAALVATAVAVARAAASVEDLRDRVARARLEERRAIRRELHDGLGPSLAGIRLGIQGASNLVGADQAAARRLLEALEAELGERVDAVRSLSHHLLPPALEELGLGVALEELARRYAQDGLDVAVEVHVDDLDVAVAAAAYAIATEALSNLHRHGRARHGWVCVRRDREGDEEGVVLQVADDGRGIAPGAPVGVGTRSMRERAAELGGHVEVGRRPGGGTVVTARFPRERR